MEELAMFLESIDWIDFIVTTFFLVGVIGLIKLVDTPSNNKRALSRLKYLQDFYPTQKVMGCDGITGLAIDEKRQKICLISDNGVSPSQRVHSFEDVLSVEIYEDEISVTKTSRPSQLGGAIVGGLLLGAVGAIIGGLSGKTVTSSKVGRIELRVTVNSTRAPIHNVTFMNIPSSTDSAVYKNAIQAARHWHGVIAALIRRSNGNN